MSTCCSVKITNFMHHQNAYIRTLSWHCYVYCVVVWGFDKKTVAVLREMQGKTKSHLGQENGDTAAAEKVFVYMTTSTISTVDDLYHVL